MKQIKHGSCKRTKFRQPSGLRKPVKAKQTKKLVQISKVNKLSKAVQPERLRRALRAANQAQSMLLKAKRANQKTSHVCLHSRLRPPSHTGRRSHTGNVCYYDCSDIYRRSHAGYACSYDCTEIYRRSHAGYACAYDCTEIYRAP